jgi:hypothetical protein
VQRTFVQNVVGSLERGVIVGTLNVVGWHEAPVIFSKEPVAKNDLDEPVRVAREPANRS